MITGGVGQRDMGVRQVVVGMELIERSGDRFAIEGQFTGVGSFGDDIGEEMLRSLGSALRVEGFGEHIHRLDAMVPRRHHRIGGIAIGVTNVIERGGGTKLVDSSGGDVAVT